MARGDGEAAARGVGGASAAGGGAGGNGGGLGARADALAAEADALVPQMDAQMEEEEEDNDDFEWSDDDGPHPDEAADQQRALVESFESEKKLQDDTHASEDTQICRAVELSLQAAQQGRVGDDAMLGQRCLVTALRMERWRAQQELRRRGGDDEAGPSNAPPGGQ